MCWTTLIKFFENKFILKNIWIYLILTPIVAFLISYGFEFKNYRIGLFGACLVFVSYALIKLFSPRIIKDFKNGDHYLDSLVSRKRLLNIVTEFSLLDNCFGHQALDPDLKDFLPVNEGRKILSKEQSILKYGRAKFTLLAYSKPVVRVLISSLLIFGLVFMYYQLLINILKIMMS